MLFLTEAPRSLCLETASECNSSDLGNSIINILGGKKNPDHIEMEGLLGGWHVPIISESQDRKGVGLGQPGLPKERNRRFLCSWMASSYRTVVFNSIQYALWPGLGAGGGGLVPL